MGLYVTNCPQCNKAHQWFSGNTDTRCPDCRNPKPKETNMEAELIAALKQTIAVQETLIKQLQAEINRLNTQPIYIPPLNGPNTVPMNPTYPGLSPLPWVPGSPTASPWVQPPGVYITSGASGATPDNSISGPDLIPPGGLQCVTYTDLGSTSVK